METTPGKRLQQWREFKSCTLTEMHRLTGVKVTTLSQAESGTTNPSYDTITKVLAAYPDLNPDWLLMGTGPMLRDGRALAPVAVPLARPDATASLTVSYPTPEEYRQLQDEIRRLREQLSETERQLAQKDGKLTAVEEERVWLRKQVGGKTEASAEAAGKDAQPPVMVAARNHEYVEVPAEEQERYSRVGFVWGR